MSRSSSKKNAQYIKKNKQRRRWRKAVTSMAAVVVFFTTYALILPAITMEGKTYCGLSQHIHDEADGCYEKHLICGKETEDAQAEEPVYEQEYVLVCEKEGIPMLMDAIAVEPSDDDEVSQVHVHDESCYEMQRVLVCGYDDEDDTVSEGFSADLDDEEILFDEEDAFDGAEAYDAYDAYDAAEEDGGIAHEHTDACYEWRKVLVCGLGEEDADGLFAEEEDKEADEGIHYHDESCYAWVSVPVETEAAAPHVHDESCYETVLVCDRIEHIHDESCYEAPEEELQQAAETEADKDETAAAEIIEAEITEAGFEMTDANPAETEEITENAEPAGEAEDAAEDFEETEDFGEAEDFEEANESIDEFTGLGDEYEPDEYETEEVGTEEYETEEELSTEVLEEEQTEEELPAEPIVLIYGGEDYRITAAVPPEASFPPDVRMEVEELTGEEYESTLAAAKEFMELDEIHFARFFDITFYDGDEKIEPQAPVQIEITYLDASYIEDTEEAEETEETEETENVDEVELESEYDEDETEEKEVITAAIHFADEGTELLDTQMDVNDDGEKVYTFSQDSFSVTGTVEGAVRKGPLKAQGQNIPEAVQTVDSRADGITLNLFDYWVGNSSSASEEKNNTSTYEDPRTTGINSGKNDKNRDLQFYSYGSKGDSINNYPSDNTPNQNVVNKNLGRDGYPELTTGGGSLAYLFKTDQWNYGKQSYPDVNHLFQKDADGYYWYNSDTNYAEYQGGQNGGGDFKVYGGTYNSTCEDGKNYPIGFFPFNEYNSNETCLKNFDGHEYKEGVEGSGKPAGTYYNHHLGLTMEAKFELPKSRQVNGKDIIFSFSGDDDMWVYIDDVLVLNVGGLHEPSGGTINFKDGTVQLAYAGNTTIEQCFKDAGREWDPDALHTIKAFYLERGGCYSNLRLTFNLPIVKHGSIEIKKSLDGEYTDTDKNTEYSFNLKVNGNNFAPDVNQTVVKENAQGVRTPVQLTNGNFTLKADERLIVEGLDENDSYVVTETNISGNVVRVSEVNSEKTQVIQGTGTTEFAADEASVSERRKNEFVNTIYPKINVGVKKTWIGTPKDEIQVQLYRDGWRKETQTVQVPDEHTVRIIVKYVSENHQDKNDVVFTQNYTVKHGSNALFTVSTLDTEQAGVTNASIVSGSAVLTKTGTSGNPTWFDNVLYYPRTSYSLSNITSDVTIEAECKSDWSSKGYSASVENFSSSGGSGSTTKIEETFVNTGIEPYGAPVTLSSGNSWEHVWQNLEKRDADGNLYSYYLKENVPDGYTASYSGTVEAATKDGSTVHKVEAEESLTITNKEQPKPISIDVEKKWVNAPDVKPAIQVQLYRKERHIEMVQPETEVPETEPVTTHKVYVAVHVQDSNGWDGSDRVKQNFDVEDGGSLEFKVDLTQSTRGLIVDTAENGSAVFSHEPPNDLQQGTIYDRNGQSRSGYTAYLYKCSNVKSDIYYSVIVRSYYREGENNAGISLISSSPGTRPTPPPPDPIPNEVIQIVPCGDPITLNDVNQWKHTWSGITNQDEDGYKYTYYIKEIGNLEGYTVSYSSTEYETLNDGSKVYRIDGSNAITITNSRDTHEVPIPVEKHWGTGVSNQSDLDVYLVLCDSSGSPVTDADNRAIAVRLNESNQWKGNFTRMLPIDFDTAAASKLYSIREISNVSENQGNNKLPAVVTNGGSEEVYYHEGDLAEEKGIVIIGTNGYIVQYTNNNSTLIATNNTAYKMPETGGFGTTGYKLAGLLIMIGSLALAGIRRQRRGGSTT